MSTPSGPAPAHRSVSNIRPGPSTTGAPTSPHTPLRTISSTFGSPSALRAEEECVIIELGARFLRAGFAGDAVPKAVIGFGPEEQRRAGDYRRWEVDYEKTRISNFQEKTWGEEYELWKPDLRGLDLGLVGDKIDRALRDAYTKFLLTDSRPRRMVLVLPSSLPLPLLSTVLETLFTNFQPPTISLMSAPVLTTIAAGLRSALIVDVGWAETVITAVYEYREVQCRRSIRGTKMLGEATRRILARAMGIEELLDAPENLKDEAKIKALPSFEECEEILARVAWCKPLARSVHSKLSQGLTPVKEEDEFRSSMRSLKIGGGGQSGSISIPLRSTRPPKTPNIPFVDLAEPCETALFATGRKPHDLDDEELPLNLLIYRSLLQLPLDARSMCMSRIIFVGGGSNLPGLKTRIFEELTSMIEDKGWDPVCGVAVEQLYNNPHRQRSTNRKPAPIKVPRGDDSTNGPAIPAAFVEHDPDPIEEQIKREAMKGNKPAAVVLGDLRIIESMGAWSGGSLLSQLKIPAVSVVDRDQWAQHGLSGASKLGESTVGQRQSMGPAAFKSGAGDRSSWTLGHWG